MDLLFELFERKLASVTTIFTRKLIKEINWESQLIGIKGARVSESQPCCCNTSSFICKKSWITPYMLALIIFGLIPTVS